MGAPELDDEAARLASELLWAERSERHNTLFYDVVAPSPRLIIFGAVDVAAGGRHAPTQQPITVVATLTATEERSCGGSPNCIGRWEMSTSRTL